MIWCDTSGLAKKYGRRTLAAGNGIFGCRDGRPKSALETACVARDRRSETIPGKNPRRTGLFLCRPKNYGLAGLDGGLEFDRWKDAASRCTAVRLEVETASSILTLHRAIWRKLEPVSVYFGPLAHLLEADIDAWQRFPIRRPPGGKDLSITQVLSMALIFRLATPMRPWVMAN